MYFTCHVENIEQSREAWWTFERARNKVIFIIFTSFSSFGTNAQTFIIQISYSIQIFFSPLFHLYILIHSNYILIL